MKTNLNFPYVRNISATTIAGEYVTKEEEVRVKKEIRDAKFEALKYGKEFDLNDDKFQLEKTSRFLSVTPLPNPTGIIYHIDVKYE